MTSETSLAFRTSADFDAVHRTAAWVAALSGWRRYCFALFLGILAAGALPPVDLVPLLVPAFAGLIWLLDGTPTRRGAFALGWCFGFGYFVAGLYWIAIALLVDVERFWWLMPFGAMGLPAFFAVYTGAATLVCRLAGARGISRILVLALAWTGAEWLRGHLLTGFPWNLVGYAWSGGFPGGTWVLQSTALFGIHGLGLLTVVAAALPAACADASGQLSALRRWAPALAALAIVVVLGAGGGLRLAGATAEHQPDILLRLVQPSIAQTLKWDPTERIANFRRHLALSAAQPGTRAPTHIVWSEAAATFFLEREPTARAAIAAIVPPGGLLLAGAPRSDPPPEPQTHVWNSLEAIDHGGDIIAAFDKFHLVPFGEYVPLRGILPIGKITAGNVDFTAGPGPRTLELPGLPPVGPLICYEAIFPGAVVDAAHRPAWLLNVTNDAWYGFSSGPFQHFAIARVRAIEEGLPLVRAANNGISGVFDPYGRVVARLGLDSVGVIDAPLPVPLEPTPYARAGDGAALALAILLIAVVAIRRAR